MSRCSPALLLHLVESGACDRDFIGARTTGFAAAFEAARASVPSLAEAARIADVDPGDLAPVLRLVRRHRAHRHALFAGREPVLRRHRQGQRDHQLPSRDRPHRPPRHGAVLADRPAERDGRARGRRSREPARRAYGFRQPGRYRPGPPLLGRARTSRPGPVSRPSSCSTRCSTAGSRRFGCSAPTRPPACRALRGCARRWPRARSSWSAIAGRPTRRALPMSCCRPPAGARRTAR